MQVIERFEWTEGGASMVEPSHSTLALPRAAVPAVPASAIRASVAHGEVGSGREATER